MMRCIILLAGTSKRLRPLTDATPKCLLPLSESTCILKYQLDALLMNGVNDIRLILGFQSDKIRAFVKENYPKAPVSFIENAQYATTDNAFSLLLGLEDMDIDNDGVIILDGDVVFDAEILKELIESPSESIMCCNNDRAPQDEDCKIVVENDSAVGMGKSLNGQYVYTSIIRIGQNVMGPFLHELKKKRGTMEWYSGPLNNIMGKELSIDIMFTNGRPCFEIDDFDDLKYARERIRDMQ